VTVNSTTHVTPPSESEADAALASPAAFSSLTRRVTVCFWYTVI